MPKVINIKILHSAMKSSETIALSPGDPMDADMVLGAIGSQPLRRRHAGETTGTVSLSQFSIKESVASKGAGKAIASIGDEALRAGMSRLREIYRDHWASEGFIALASVDEV